jgi:membrane protein
VWELPYAQRLTFGAQIRRSLIALAAIGVSLVGSTVISSYVTGTTTGTKLGVVSGLAGYLIAFALDVGLFIVAFRLLTGREVSTRDVPPGALLSGVVFWLLPQCPR